MQIGAGVIGEGEELQCLAGSMYSPGASFVVVPMVLDLWVLPGTFLSVFLYSIPSVGPQLPSLPDQSLFNTLLAETSSRPTKVKTGICTELVLERLKNDFQSDADTHLH